MKRKNLINKRFGQWTVLKELPLIGKYRKCICQCSCKKITEVNVDSLLRGLSKSCGCRKGRNLKDIRGKTFNRLTVLHLVRGKKRIMWRCRCSCGKIAIVASYHLISGHTKSCGCLFKEEIQKRVGKNHPSYKHGLGYINRRYRNSRQSYDLRYDRWSLIVKTKANYTCQSCNLVGKKGDGSLHSHHIQSYASYPKLIYTVSNGVCLCVNCHKKLHKIFGQVTTKKDLQNFLQK